MENNRTLRILADAEREGYGVLAQVCYDTQMAIALVRAAERAKSPAILQFFPVTLEYGKGPFLGFCLDLAHGASVPISVHLDHATDPAHLELAIRLAENGVAFDSIMVDASHAETDEENIAITKPYVDRLHKLGIAVEVELGRLEGGEAGLRMISDAKLTNPEKAKTFMQRQVLPSLRIHKCFACILLSVAHRIRIHSTGANILAPSIGNLHGSYLKPPNFRQNILQDLRAEFKGVIPLCLHGTDELPDELFKECISNGVSKINVNSWARDPYAKALSDGLRSKAFPDAVEEATEVFATACERFFTLFGSAGKAPSH